MKTYVITLSRVFPKSHIRAGEPTGFKDKLLNGTKIHTIRSNYPLWKKRIDEIQKGDACLSIRQWTDKPYRSKQIEIARFTKDDGIGLESITLPEIYDLVDVFNDYPGLDTNDGLTREDWLHWFSGYETNKQMPIIHFTGFRYKKS